MAEKKIYKQSLPIPRHGNNPNPGWHSTMGLSLSAGLEALTTTTKNNNNDDDNHSA